MRMFGAFPSRTKYSHTITQTTSGLQTVPKKYRISLVGKLMSKSESVRIFSAEIGLSGRYESETHESVVYKTQLPICDIAASWN